MGYIYKITNQENGKMYVGKTERTPKERFQEHIKKAKLHTNRYLYDAMNHYGYENFVIETLEECEINQLNEREIYWISFLNTLTPNGYNMTNGGDGGNTWDKNNNKELISLKLSIANRGKKRSQEFCEILSKKLTGRKLPSEPYINGVETRKNNIIKNTRYSSWEERQEYIAMCNKLFHEPRDENGNRIPGFFHHSEEAKKKISDAHKGKTYEEIYGEEYAAIKRESAKNRFLGKCNPLYKDVNKDKLLELILNNEKIIDIAAFFNVSKPTINHKCKEYFGTSKIREVKKKYEK